jgi:hypothetical protein
MNKILFPYLISMALSTGCTVPDSPGTRTTSVATPGTATAYVPPPGPATTSTANPTSDNYGLYTDADLQIYADTLDVRIQEALKKNDTIEAQALGQKRQELITEFNRRGLKRHPAEPTIRPHHSRKAKQRESRVNRPRTSVNPPAPGLPGEQN